jgi:hypothetical protein
VGWFEIWVGVCVFLREESVEIGRDGVCLLCVAGVVLMCFFVCVGGSSCYTGLIGKLPNEVGYWCVYLSGEDVF